MAVNTWTTPANGEDHTMHATVRFKIVEGPGADETFCYDEPTPAICGRADDCDPRIAEPGPRHVVSRHHCVFDISPPQIRVRDFGSRNGTHVNGEEIGRRLPGQTPRQGPRLTFREHDLSDGDTVTIGNTVLTVAVSAAQSSRTTTLPDGLVCPVCDGPVPEEERPADGKDPVCRQCQGDPAALTVRLLKRFVSGEGAEQPEIRDYELVEKLGRGGAGGGVSGPAPADRGADGAEGAARRRCGG